jgi:subtilisin-like proprotein convertase family protein
MATGPTNFLNNTPVAIPDGPGGMAQSTIDATGIDSYLCDVNLTTDITHTFGADLEITLTSPAGTVVTITTDNGGGNDNVFSGTVWDDDGGDTNAPGAVTDNVFDDLVTETPLVPEEALGAFIGEDPNGTWTLDITDDASADTGTLNSWSLDITTCIGGGPQVPVIEVPTVDRMGLALLALLLVAAGAFVLMRRQ